MAPSHREASPQLQEAMDETATRINKTIEKLLPDDDLPEAQLFSAMRYGTLNGGKRLRPLMVMESAKIFNVDPTCSRRVAAAIELVHCYSLIHDDMPAMDNADKRRGKPTVHKEYDEATSLLAGDALLTMAFEILSDSLTHEDPRVRCSLISGLAKAAGGHGMCGGQMLDLLGEKQDLDLGTISRLQRMKTGKLIAFSCESGAILGKSSDPQHRALSNYAYDLGLAFQITDDILDVEGDELETGKETGKDQTAGKSTFVSEMGIENAKARAEMLIEQSIGHLKMFGNRAEMLIELANYVLQRRA